MSAFSHRRGLLATLLSVLVPALLTAISLAALDAPTWGWVGFAIVVAEIRALSL